MHQLLQSTRVTAVVDEAEGIKRFELSPVSGRLMPLDAGAHVDLHLPHGLTRSYSLLDATDADRRYRIAVHRAPDSRGGSRWIHEHVAVGDRIEVGLPRNNFPMHDGPEPSVLVAGGIGITPLLAMIGRLERRGGAWTLHYASRTRRAAAFLAELAALESAGPGRVHLVFDHEPGGKPLDLPAIVDAAAPEAHLYCCGPAGMLAAFEAACAGRPAAQVHVEHFSATAPPAVQGGFTVVAARSGREFAVPPGQTILDVLLDAGIEVPCSCLEGTCGSCELRVLEGLPDHRDVVLSEAERASNARMLVCCSGALSARLVLDI